MTSTLHIDFETRSAADLKAVGLANYASDPTTEVVCLAYAFGDEPVRLWSESGQTHRMRVLSHAAQGLPVYAHNAQFEHTLWNQVLNRDGAFGELRLGQMRCTLAMAYAMGLPGSLGDAAAAVGLEQQKDMAGHRLMLQMSKPRKVEPDGTIVWWDDADRLERLYAYCKQDVETERALHQRLMELSPDEQDLWALDQRINARGIGVDMPSIDKAIALVNAERARLDAEIRAVTGNAVAGCTDVKMLTEWLRYRGVKIKGVAKADVLDALSHDALPEDCRRALELRQEAAKSSTAKLASMRSRAGADGRMRGLFQYHGAATGRWAGRGPQPHNFTRPTILKRPRDVADCFAHLGDRNYLSLMYGAPMALAADMLRGMIVPAPGNEFICCDYSNIEGRVLAWLAGEAWKLQAFRDFDAGTGADIYKLAYGRAFGIRPEDVDDAMRQVGKVMELALGYGGGVGAFQTMARGYGVQVSDERADELKAAWRAAHPHVKQFWAALERAAIDAVLSPGEVERAGKIAYVARGSFLWCRLPSGRVLCYPYPRVEQKETPWGQMRPSLTYMTVDSRTRKWARCDTYGGSLAENVTQAAARDILVAGMRQCEAHGYPVVMHVHDEIVAEVLRNSQDVAEMASLMCRLPKWAAGLPLAAAGWRGPRYRKD